jgi:hypothetical protein
MEFIPPDSDVSVRSSCGLFAVGRVVLLITYRKVIDIVEFLKMMSNAERHLMRCPKGQFLATIRNANVFMKFIGSPTTCTVL